MSKINVLAVLVADGKSIPIKSKSALKQLISTSAELVKIVPVEASPSLVAATSAYNLPTESVFVAHSPSGRKWTAEISRTESHEFSIR
jgi:hypothetical protein